VSPDVLTYVLIGLGSALLIGAVALLVVRLRRREARNQIRSLAGRRAELSAALHATQEAMDSLAQADEEHLAEFAHDTGSEERQTFSEIAVRMRIVTSELINRPVRQALRPVSSELAGAATMLAEDVAAIGDGDGPALLAAVDELDMSAMLSKLHAADDMLLKLCERYGANVDEIYGGGLYI